MPGRVLRDEAWFAETPYAGHEFARRRAVLRETLAAFAARGDELRARAERNLARWAAGARPAPRAELRVVAGDWGEVTLELTRTFGERFAVLNMANAFVPGGAYVEGTAAQEENLFRRTDCHFAVTDDQLAGEHYTPEMTALLSARGGRVYLDVARPRTCVRGAEDRRRADLGYRWLDDDELFSFYELRAAAPDLRGGRRFDPVDTAARIGAQLDTLIAANVRFAVLSAFGCGAFGNPPDEVARLYRDAWAARAPHFGLVAFAIFHPGYGPDNHAVFERVLS